MADLAIVFHWQADFMDRLGLAELMEWRARAAKRVEPDK